MHIRGGRLRKVVDDEGDALKIHASRDQLGRDEHPHLPARNFDGGVALRLRATAWRTSTLRPS